MIAEPRGYLGLLRKKGMEEYRGGRRKVITDEKKNDRRRLV